MQHRVEIAETRSFLNRVLMLHHSHVQLLELSDRAMVSQQLNWEM
jgi:hypothetical protein